MNTTKISFIILLLCAITTLSAQYQWRLRDPLDLNIIDFGDNKVLLYNGLGIGLSYLIDGRARYNDDNYKDWELSGTLYMGYRPELKGEITQLSVRRRFLLKKYLAIGIEGRLLAYTNEFIPGIGFSPTFTWYIINKPGLRVAYDNGVGPNLFLSPWPENGTRFNFSTFYGLKVEWLVSKQWYHLGLQNLHISNADVRGRERNPPFDGVGITLGLLF